MKSKDEIKYRVNHLISVSKSVKYLKKYDWFICFNINTLSKAISMKPRGLIITKQMLSEFNQDIKCPYMICENPQKTWALIASLAYNKRPSFIVGVTGSNGKTSVSYTTYLMLSKLGAKVAYVGTNGVIPDIGYKSTLTTPDAAELHKILHLFAENGITHVVVEISSAGLAKKRAHCLNLDVAVFTSFSDAHLNANTTKDQYWQAKISINDLLRNKKNFLISNEVMYYLNEYSKTRNKQYLYKVYNKTYEYENENFIGFMLDNLQAACRVCEIAGYKRSEIKKVVKDMKLTIPGRLEKICNDPVVIVDFANTPEGLEHLLDMFKDQKKIVIFGCAGNKDIDKRPLLGEILKQRADVVIITDDNPRDECPAKIRKELLAKCSNAIEEPCRRSAIYKGITMAIKKNYMCIIAGKGHETEQVFKDKVVPFSDVEVAKSILYKYKKLAWDSDNLSENVNNDHQ